MRTAISSLLPRLVLATAAVLVIGGPGLVMADGGGSTYLRPKCAVVVGPGSVSTGGDYQLRVTFSDDSQATYSSPDATFGVSGSTGTASGSFSGGSLASTGTGKLSVTGSYSNTEGAVTAFRRITVTN